jgi:hypothetical protein
MTTMLPDTFEPRRRPRVDGPTVLGTTAQRLNAPRRPDPADAPPASPVKSRLDDLADKLGRGQGLTGADVSFLEHVAHGGQGRPAVQFYRCGGRCGRSLGTDPYPCLECGGPAVLSRSHRPGRVELRW